MIGADAEAIDKAEDRLKFRDAMDKIGLESARSRIAHTLEEAIAALDHTGLPAIIRPSFTLGGTGGGVAYNRDEFVQIVTSGLERSEEHTSELQSLMRISYAVFCLKKKIQELHLISITYIHRTTQQQT